MLLQLYAAVIRVLLRSGVAVRITKTPVVLLCSYNLLMAAFLVDTATPCYTNTDLSSRLFVCISCSYLLLQSVAPAFFALPSSRNRTHTCIYIYTTIYCKISMKQKKKKKNEAIDAM